MILFGLLPVIAAVVFGPRGCDLLVGNVPMVVYGRVVDQNGAPLPGAVVAGIAEGHSLIQAPDRLAEGGVVQWAVAATTDGSGAFVVAPGRGQAIYLDSVTKDGYSRSDASGFTAVFGYVPLVTPFVPDSHRPVELIVWNDRFKRIVKRTSKFEIPLDADIRMVDLLTGKLRHDSGASPTLDVMLVSAPERPASKWAVDVQLMINGRVRDAGAVPGPTAPLDGYKPTLRFTEAPANGGVQHVVTAHFYGRVRNDFFGSFNLTVTPNADGNTAAVTLDYVGNFEGSPDLTPGPRAAPH